MNPLTAINKKFQAFDIELLFVVASALKWSKAKIILLFISFSTYKLIVKSLMYLNIDIVYWLIVCNLLFFLYLMISDLNIYIHINVSPHLKHFQHYFVTLSFETFQCTTTAISHDINISEKLTHCKHNVNVYTGNKLCLCPINFIRKIKRYLWTI